MSDIVWYVPDIFAWRILRTRLIVPSQLNESSGQQMNHKTKDSNKPFHFYIYIIQLAKEPSTNLYFLSDILITSILSPAPAPQYPRYLKPQTSNQLCHPNAPAKHPASTKSQRHLNPPAQKLPNPLPPHLKQCPQKPTRMGKKEPSSSGGSTAPNIATCLNGITHPSPPTPMKRLSIKMPNSEFPLFSL